MYRIRLTLPDESKDEQLLRIERVLDLEVSLEESGQGLWEQEQGKAIALTNKHDVECSPAKRIVLVM